MIDVRAREASARGDPLDECCAENEYPTWVGPLVGGRCTYYMDREKVYPFQTGERGAALLAKLVETNTALLELNRARIEDEARAADTTADVVVRTGHGLYSEKPTLRTKGVTWSTEEYGHPGLQRMYLRMKSFQRFTETWATLERAAGIGVFDEVFQRGTGTVRIASIGGGPGYELLATRLFFLERAPEVELELTSLDLCAAWRPYVEQLGFQFVHFDINDGNLLEALGLGRGELNFCIVSCVMIYVTNDATLDMFHRLVHEEGVRAILLNERGEKTEACAMMEDRGGAVIRLIDQTLGVDERQTVFCSTEFSDSQLRGANRREEELTFPNVPFEEHKHKQQPAADRSSRDRGGSWREKRYDR